MVKFCFPWKIEKKKIYLNEKSALNFVNRSLMELENDDHLDIFLFLKSFDEKVLAQRENWENSVHAKKSSFKNSKKTFVLERKLLVNDVSVLQQNSSAAKPKRKPEFIVSTFISQPWKNISKCLSLLFGFISFEASIVIEENLHNSQVLSVSVTKCVYFNRKLHELEN